MFGDIDQKGWMVSDYMRENVIVANYLNFLQCHYFIRFFKVFPWFHEILKLISVTNGID